MPIVLITYGTQYPMKCNNCYRENPERKKYARNNNSLGDAMRPVSPRDLLNKDDWTMEEVQAKRIGICESCEHFNKVRQCTLCFCYMDAKTYLENAYCPVRKW